MATKNGTVKFFDLVQDALNGDKDKNENGRTVNSGERLTIETIGDFAERIRKNLGENDTVFIEFQDDVELDITALQILCSACRTAAAAGKKIMCRGPLPDSLGQLAATAGSERHDHCKIDSTSCFRKLGGLK